MPKEKSPCLNGGVTLAAGEQIVICLLYMSLHMSASMAASPSPPVSKHPRQQYSRTHHGCDQRNHFVHQCSDQGGSLMLVDLLDAVCDIHMTAADDDVYY